MALAISDHPHGVLRVASTVAFGKSQLNSVLAGFLERYPEIRVSLSLTDHPIDLAADGIDVAIHFTEQLDRSSVIVRKLTRNRRVICAAPDYLASHGVPQTPKDLMRLNCLTLSTVTAWNDWDLEAAAGEALAPLEGNFEADSADAVYHAALAGLGVARLSTYLVGDDLRAGRLVRVLPDYAHDGSDIVAIYPERRNLPSKVRVFVDHLVARFSPPPPWETAA